MTVVPKKASTGNDNDVCIIYLWRDWSMGGQQRTEYICNLQIKCWMEQIELFCHVLLALWKLSDLITEVELV